MPLRKLQIVVPVFNDWPSFVTLLGHLDRACAPLDWAVSVMAIDDGSTDAAPSNNLKPFAALRRVQMVELAMNVGHQRAIAIGLSMAIAETDVDAVIVMDSDGEDRPEDIPRLLAAASGQSEFAVVAQRLQRMNSLIFKLFYALYKTVFAILTGHNINFGNFCLISRAYAKRLIMTAELWNNFPAALLRLRVPIVQLPTDRGHRYAGTSKMNYVSLIVHGMSGISVYSDVIFVRMLVATGGFLVFSVIAITAVVSIRLFSNLATPGWTTTVVFGILIILLQTMVSTLTTMLLLLNNRSQRNIIPARDYRDFVLSSSDLTSAALQPTVGATQQHG